MVGAVLARQGRIIGEGWHHRFGGPHAEVEAIADVKRRGFDSAGATIYVTLEPCSHVGKTPPCADALIAAKIARAVIAMVDPFERVAGQGVDRLRSAGMAVEVGVCEQDARQLNEAYLKRIATGLPWVIAKWAQTLDGRIAVARGDSRWISNELSRQYVHQLRARVDAIVVGVNTVIHDDPQLTARGVRRRRIARRVVVDPNLRLPPEVTLLRDVAAAPLSIAVRPALLDQPSPRLLELQTRGIEFISLPMRRVLHHLARHHTATNVLIEGGSRLLGSMFDDQLVDQVLAFVAPKLLGDPKGIPVAAGCERACVADAHRLRLRSVKRLGDDVLLDYRVSSV